jgi:hypothetical protein
MTILEPIINEVSEQFGLRGKAGPLMTALLALISNERTGGLQGFLDQFRRAGLGEIVSSWVSRGSNTPITTEQLERAIGGDTINRIGSNAGVGQLVSGRRHGEARAGQRRAGQGRGGQAAGRACSEGTYRRIDLPQVTAVSGAAAARFSDISRLQTRAGADGISRPPDSVAHDAGRDTTAGPDPQLAAFSDQFQRQDQILRRRPR